MAVHDTEKNGRTGLTEQTINSLMWNIDWHKKHRVFIIDNGSCEATKLYLAQLPKEITVITLPENLGTAVAINEAWRQRLPGEHCIKMDNDVIIHSKTWIEEMEYAIQCDPRIGQVGLKRKDVWEFPTHQNPELRSILKMLPHTAGQPWMVVEQAKHIIGTCVMHSSKLLDRVGYLWQPGLYGYDDVLMSWRSNLSGFYTCFIPHIEIDHIDPGGDEYTDWKNRHSGQYQQLQSDIVDEYIARKRSLYVP